MPARYYPRWDPPEIDEWDDEYGRDDERQCGPFAALAVGAVGLALLCRPRRQCWPRPCYPRYCNPRCFPYSCNPYYACSPTYICYPRSCLPFPLV